MDRLRTRRYGRTEHSSRVLGGRVLVAVAASIVLLVACARPKSNWDAMFAGGRTCDTLPRPVAPGEPLGATLPSDVRAAADSGTLIGTVTEQGTQRTIRDATVALFVASSRDSSGPPAYRTATSATGGFTLRALPGRYDVRVRRIGQRSHEQRINLDAGTIDTMVVGLSARRCIEY